jgi:hypothetical protein
VSDNGIELFIRQFLALGSLIRAEDPRRKILLVPGPRERQPRSQLTQPLTSDWHFCMQVQAWEKVKQVILI